MRESIIQTTINKFLTWLAKKSVTALYKRTHFWTFSWGLDENTDLYLMSEESYHDYHRFGVREEKYADIPQTDLVKESPSLVKDLVNAFCEDGTWLERQGVYTLTLAEAKQRAVDIIEAVSRKDTADTPQTEEVSKEYKRGRLDALSELKAYIREMGTYGTADTPQTDCGWSKPDED